MTKQLLAGLALLCTALATPAVAAPSLGDVVTCGAVNFECSNFEATVGSGAEFGITLEPVGTLLTADFSAGLLTITNVNNPAFDGGFFVPDNFALQFTNLTTAFTVASLGTLTGVGGFDASKLSLAEGFLTLDLSNTTFLPSASLQVRLDQAPPQAAVPEPTTWALMILGFGAVGYSMRRRKVGTLQPSRA